MLNGINSSLELQVPLTRRLSLWTRKIVIGLLLLNSLWGLLSMISFLFIEYPLLDQQLKAGEITLIDVAHLITMMIMTLINLSISLTLAVYLNKLRQDVAKVLDLVLAIIFLVAAPFAQQWLLETQLIQGFLEQVL